MHNIHRHRVCVISTRQLRNSTALNCIMGARRIEKSIIKNS